MTPIADNSDPARRRVIGTAVTSVSTLARLTGEPAITVANTMLIESLSILRRLGLTPAQIDDYLSQAVALQFSKDSADG